MEYTPYLEVRRNLLDCYYQYCRIKVSEGKAWREDEYEIGFAYDQYFNAYDSPIEKLMLEILTLILVGGRLESAAIYHKANICKLLLDNDLDLMLSQILEDERVEIYNDLKVLNLLPPDGNK
jgi:hypothetical protein